MKIKTRVKKIANHIPRGSYFFVGVAVGAGITGFLATRDIRGLEIVDINLIHDTVENIDFLCVARANGSHANYLFEMTK